jgi:hypothetical protein
LEVMTSRFSIDTGLNFLTVREGLKHRTTSRVLVYNFGLGIDCCRYSTTDERFLKPPYNMITEQDLVDRFDFLEVDWFDVRKIEPDKLYTPIAGSEDARLLASGWCEPEPWGTWTAGERAVIEIGCDLEGDQSIELQLKLKAFIPKKDSRLKDLGLSEDKRKIGLGLSSIKATRIPGV